MYGIFIFTLHIWGWAFRNFVKNGAMWAFGCHLGANWVPMGANRVQLIALFRNKRFPMPVLEFLPADMLPGWPRHAHIWGQIDWGKLS
jgi:hypothetical protein